MDNKKWTDSDLKTAFKDGCKFVDFADLQDFLLKRRQLAASTESKCNKHIVNNRTWIITIECGEDTTDHKVTAPNELAARMVASSSYNRKRFNILRCVEYGC